MASGSEGKQVFLLGAVRLLHEHLTAALCHEVHHEVRKKERQRDWTLYALAKFWIEVIIRAPKSLTQALEECSQASGSYPQVNATPEAFFQKSASLRPDFFARLLERFLHSVLPEATLTFGREFQPLQERFPEVWVIDGSKLSAVWHRLKKLWTVRSVVLPGALLVLYDLRRGIIRHLHYSVDAARAEILRAKEAIKQLPEGALLVGDRLFGLPTVFAAVQAQHAWLLARRNATVTFRSRKKLRSGHFEGGKWTEYVVQVGGTGRTPRQTWRYLKWRGHGHVHELVTNVLDATMLSASEALQLYRARWSIERMFYDLKEVLNLNRIYPSSPYAVTQQVYASALVHTALRVAQGHLAAERGIQAEEISVEKFFPRLAAASISYVNATLVLEEVVALNPHKELTLPDVDKMDFATVPLRSILVEKRNDRRRKRKFCKARKKWISFAHVTGMKQVAKQ